MITASRMATTLVDRPNRTPMINNRIRAAMAAAEHRRR